MAGQELSSKPQRRPNRTAKAGGERNKRKPKAAAAENVYGAPVPEGLHEAIESERDNLAKAESVLGCLVVSLEYEGDLTPAPHYPDVARLVRELIRQSINGLDSLHLQRCVLRNRIKEEFAPCWYAQSMGMAA